MASLLGAAGCVNVPTSGTIEKVEGQQQGCQNCVNVEVAPPAPGDEPRQIVEGYLRATSNYQPNYSVARQFLTRMAAEKWSPEGGVWIYRGSPKAVGPATVLLDGWLVGSLGTDRTYKAEDRKLTTNFVLAKENGEWRINTLPPGLLVAEYSFTSLYQPYDLYFVGNGTSLVPDPIYLPALNNPANIASALVKALLNGPSKWLKPAVSTAIPPNTTLSVDSVTITDGIADVQLSDSVLALPDPQRSLLAAQIAYTLKQAGGVRGVAIKVNQQPYRVPGSDPNNPVVSVESIPRDIDPIPFVAGEQLYAVASGVVKQVSTTNDSRSVNAVAGPIGHGKYPVNALAVSVTNTDLAATTNGRTTLIRAPIATGKASALLSGKTELLRPQFTRYGEIWDIGREAGRQRMWMFTADNKQVDIDSPMFQNVKAFKISPDGTRMALVRTTKAGAELGLARIIRSDKIMVEGWRSVNITQTSFPPIRRIADVAWLDATELLVLGSADATTANAPFRVVEDASQITPKGESENWNAVELAVLPRTQAAIVVGQDGRTWKDDGNQWQPFIDKISTVAYPG
ncbi:MAG TPA: LpqB family beta-propeller domain-containing protein [Propionibacteriaceae bacterium]|nr:LpqB family beta-propeller domain-containing protein [Propionibacteriaceae bacterium]